MITLGLDFRIKRSERVFLWQDLSGGSIFNPYRVKNIQLSCITSHWTLMFFKGFDERYFESNIGPISQELLGYCFVYS